MVTVKEYADLHGKSVQSVYKQMKSKENATLLEGHVYSKKINNKHVKMLDDIAVEILENASKQSVQVIMQSDEREKIDQLEKENKRLLLRIVDLQEQIVKDKESMISLQEQNKLLLEEKIAEEKKGFFSRLFGK